MFLIATPLGHVPRGAARPGGARSAGSTRPRIYLPVVLSLALVGFIWQLIYSRDQGLLNAVTGQQRSTGTATSGYNLWAVLVAASWRHAGYIMLLYLAGLKGVDPTLREAAKVDGATERTTSSGSSSR